MSIDAHTEQVISLADATHFLPKRRSGKRTNVATIYRWTKRGCRGIVLESIQVGGTRCSSREALQRFYDRLSEPLMPVSSPSVDQNRRQTEAEQELDAEGI